ncbi:MAG: carbohydrate ABC transporter permease [Sphaerochaetaceae bacterium]|nr:carbohydrate ABC transporter permease [Sphaerochaetaceae bacterium]
MSVININKKTKSTQSLGVGTYTFLIVAVILSVFPLFWMVIAATNKSVDVISGTLIPGSNLATNYKNLIGSTNLWQAMWNSFKYAGIMTVLSLLVCSIAGYGFEIYHDKHKDRLFSFLLLAMMIPFAAVMIPLYQMVSEYGLLNSTAGFVLPTISTPFLIMLFRQNSRSFPHEIIDAARIDGLSEIGIFIRIYIPTQKAVFAAAVTVVFMNGWNNYLWPKIIMQSNDSISMPMLIAGLQSGYVTDYGVLMLSVLFCILPMLIIFFAMQRYFTQGITGSIK